MRLSKVAWNALLASTSSIQIASAKSLPSKRVIAERDEDCPIAPKVFIIDMVWLIW